MSQKVISFHACAMMIFVFSFHNDNDYILLYKNGTFIFKASPFNVIYERVVCIGKFNNIILNVGSLNDVFNN